LVSSKSEVGMIRVGLPVLNAARWTGGFNYLCNLLEALHQYTPGEIEPVLYVREAQDLDGAEPLRALAIGDPVVVWRSPSRLVRWQTGFDSVVLQKHRSLESGLRRAGVGLVFQQSEWFGARFGLPTLAWIPDFQHRYLPQLFSRGAYLKREIGYRALCHSASLVMLSSEAARQDCEKFYAAARGKTAVARFAVRASSVAEEAHLAELKRRHGLPQRFFYLPNQFWKHKNHLLVVEAVRRLRDQGIEVVVVSSGSMNDSRNPSYPQAVVQRTHEYGVDKLMRFLGFIPREDIPLLMQAAVAVINPSLFEGWSTVVEEAKALAVPLVLSDLQVHREQAPVQAWYFDPADADALAGVMLQAWANQTLPEERRAAAAAATRAYEGARRNFAECFVSACRLAVERG
jgi:glycosyltransferase involved in cell wall biosynthesis